MSLGFRKQLLTLCPLKRMSFLTKCMLSQESEYNRLILPALSCKPLCQLNKTLSVGMTMHTTSCHPCRWTFQFSRMSFFTCCKAIATTCRRWWRSWCWTHQSRKQKRKPGCTASKPAAVKKAQTVPLCLLLTLCTLKRMSSLMECMLSQEWTYNISWPVEIRRGSHVVQHPNLLHCKSSDCFSCASTGKMSGTQENNWIGFGRIVIAHNVT